MGGGIQPRRKFYTRIQYLCLTGFGAVKTFFGVGSLNLKGSNPEESFIREVSTYVSMSDRSWQCVKTFFGVGSLKIKGSNPEESFIRKVSTYVRYVLADNVKTFFGVGSLKIKGSNRRRSMSIICSCFFLK